MASRMFIKLPDELKARISVMAARENKSAHAYMVDTLEEGTRIKEERARFIADAIAAKKKFDNDGLGYDAADAMSCLRAKAAGGEAIKPKLKQWLI